MGRAARTSISAASAATGFSGFPHAAAPARSTGCPALSASPPRGAAIPAGGSASGLYQGGEETERQGQPTGGGRRIGGQAAVCNAHSPSVRTGVSTGDAKLKLRARDAPSADPKTLWPKWRAPLWGAQENPSPRLATLEKLTRHLHPQPLPPPRRRLLGVVRPGAAEQGVVGRERGGNGG